MIERDEWKESLEGPAPLLRLSYVTHSPNGRIVGIEQSPEMVEQARRREAGARSDGQVTDDSTVEFLRNYMSELAMFVTRVLNVLPRQS